MPTYEYACRDCGDHLEVVQSFRDDPLTECPKCGGDLRKVFSAAPIVFKGSGWHIKDYGRSGAASPTPAADGESSSGKSDTPAGEKSSDTSSSDSSSSSSSSTSSGERKSA